MLIAYFLYKGLVFHYTQINERSRFIGIREVREKYMAFFTEKYQDKNRSEVEALVASDSFVMKDILGCLDEFPQCGWLVKEDDHILAVGVYTGIGTKTSMTLYVDPEKRRTGIGTLLLNTLEQEMRLEGIREAVCDYLVNDTEKEFLKHHGYQSWFHSNLMTYSGERLPSSSFDISSYTDSNYMKVQKIYSEAFHRMRVSVGLKSELSKPSEDERESYARNAKDILVMRVDDEIKASARIEGNEIDSIAVAVDQQGKGYGKTLLAHAVNLLLDRGNPEITLWVVEGNPARTLYEHAGFIACRRHEFVHKILFIWPAVRIHW